MLENQREDRIASSTALHDGQSLVSAHRRSTPSSHADQPRTLEARVCWRPGFENHTNGMLRASNRSRDV